MTDHELMQRAIALALKGKGFTSPNPCVGAVVVKDGKIIGEGWHRAAGMPHAEVDAIDDALKKSDANVKNATIYVTLEPCNHFGKTPPCTQKIMDNGLSKVVIGCIDPNPYVGGGGIQTLKENGIDVVSGVLKDETETLIEDFIWYIRNDKRPFVTLKSAATLDGRIATSTGDSKWITNEQSRAFGHQLRHEADAILIGSGTLHADNPSLTARIDHQETKDPVRIILDTCLTIEDTAKVIHPDASSGTIVVAGPDAPDEKRTHLEKIGVQVLTVGLENGRLDLQELMIKLGEMSIMSLLIEGGGTVAASALKAGIVNKVCYFMAPKFLGGSDGVPVFNGKGPKKISQAHEMTSIKVKHFGNDILVQGYLKK